jgi:hypothetical protein
MICMEMKGEWRGDAVLLIGMARGGNGRAFKGNEEGEFTGRKRSPALILARGGRR